MRNHGPQRSRVIQRARSERGCGSSKTSCVNPSSSPYGKPNNVFVFK
jgi:hypothetical protein